MIKTKYGELPSREERIEMAKFVRYRLGYSISWLLENVYRLIPIYNKELIKFKREQEHYHELQRGAEEQKPQYRYENGELQVLGDDGGYTTYFK